MLAGVCAAESIPVFSQALSNVDGMADLHGAILRLQKVDPGEPMEMSRQFGFG